MIRYIVYNKKIFKALEGGILMNVTERKDCRVCGSENLEDVLSLGNQHVTNFLADPKEEALMAPLDLVLCETSRGGCGLLQLKHTVQRDFLYRQYWYLSGTSTTMVHALGDLATKSESLAGLSQGDFVIDIGSNDGTLLTLLKTGGVIRVGFEPSNLWDRCRDERVNTIHDYFNRNSFAERFPNQKAKLITSVAMFYDLDNPNFFVGDIKSVLADDGLWVIQMNYLGTMLEQNTFDNISHEHLEYYSLSSLEALLKRHDLEIADVEINDVNGGSFRTYIRHSGTLVGNSPGAERRKEAQRFYENRLDLDGREVYDSFAERVARLSRDLKNFLTEEFDSGKKIYILGASTRGLVVLQYAGIDNRLIEAAADKNPDKFGRYIVGTGIPIVSLEQARANKPDYMFVLPYQFKKEIINQERDFLDQGGKMIFAMPQIHVVGKGGLVERVK